MRKYTLRYREYGKVEEIKILARDIFSAELKAKEYVNYRHISNAILIAPHGSTILINS